MIFLIDVPFTGESSTVNQPNVEYSAADCRSILSVARAAVSESVRGEIAGSPPQDVPCLLAPRGCFVTLRRRSGRLRGCVGSFDESTPLGEILWRIAQASTKDSRFADDPVRPDELPDLVISVRVLTPLVPIEDPLQLRVGVDGIYMIGPLAGETVKGCFLPEVATDQNWDVEQFLSECCEQKLGLRPDAWRAPTELKFFTFQTVQIAE